MADRPSDNPRPGPAGPSTAGPRAADKERSRQLSRPVSGKEAAKTGRMGRGSSGTSQGRGSSGTSQGRGSSAASQGRQGQRNGRGAASRPPGRPVASSRRPPGRRPARPGRSRQNLFIWGAIALVVIVVGVIVGVSQTSSTTTKSITYHPTPVSPTVLHEITHVPAFSYNAVGTGIPGAINPPRVTTSQKLLKVDGKPGMFSVLGEFCPYCAAERWAIITSLSRFGSFTGLKTMQSSPIDVYPRTQTFTFHTATYTSPFLGAELLEMYGQDKPTGSHPILKRPTKAELAIMQKYDRSGTTRSGTIPFTDIGNKVFFAGASYNPNPLQGLSRTTIAASLKNPKSPITKLILGTSNYMSAAICSIDGARPVSVCSSPGVKAAAKALKL
jgi:hypothetical protein